MEITGNIIKVLSEQVFKGRNGDVSRYGFVVETSGQYPKKVAFNVLGAEKWGKLSPAVVEGNNVQVSFDVSSREWNGKWYSSIDAYRVLVVGSPQQQQQPQVLPTQQEDNSADVMPF